MPGMERGKLVTIATMLSGPVLLYFEKRSVNTIEHFLLESCEKYKLELTDVSFFSVHLNAFHRKSIM